MADEKKGICQDFHFKICEPNIPYHEEDPEAEFRTDVGKCVRQYSKLAELDECRIELEDNISVVMVRVKVRVFSKNCSLVNVTLDEAIKDLCQGLMTGQKRNEARLSVLTNRSIWGIIPISQVFETYWTASFFGDILSNGVGQLQAYTKDCMRESQPYLAPLFMVFGVATVFGIKETFHFMQSILGRRLDPNFDFPAFAQAAFTVVSKVFRRFTKTSTSGKTTTNGKFLDDARDDFDDALTVFKVKFDRVLTRFTTIDGNTAPTILRDPQWMHDACSELCQMSVSAGEVLTKKTDLLEAVLAAISQAHEKAYFATGASAAAIFFTVTESGNAAAAVAAGGGAVPVIGPIILGVVAITTGFGAWRSYRKGVKLGMEKKHVINAGAICHSAWSNALTIHMALEWYRLHEGKDPTALDHTSLDSRQAVQDWWAQFALEHQTRLGPYLEKHERDGGDRYTQLMGVWLKSEVEDMSRKRALLP